MTRRKTRNEFIREFIAACPVGEDMVVYVNDQLSARGRNEMSSNEMKKFIGEDYATSKEARVKGEAGGDEEEQRGEEAPDAGAAEDGPPGFALVETAPVHKNKAVSNRYTMDEYAATNIYESGRKASLRLHAMLTNDAVWDRLKPSEQLRAIDTAMDRAYGRVESLSAETKLNADEASDEGVAGLLPQALADVAKKVLLPEMAKHKSATEDK